MVTKIGFVYYSDITPKVYFRVINPTLDDSEILSEPCPCGCGSLHWRGHLDPAHIPAIDIFNKGSLEARAADELMIGAV